MLASLTSLSDGDGISLSTSDLIDRIDALAGELLPAVNGELVDGCSDDDGDFKHGFCGNTGSGGFGGDDLSFVTATGSFCSTTPCLKKMKKSHELEEID